VYHADSGSYLCYDKYEGRGLDVAGVRNALYQFFSNGQHVLAAVVRATIERLRRLEAVLARKNTFRFYSSSLLLMYDAGLCGPRGSCDDDDATDADIGCSSSSSIHSHTQPHHSQQQQQVNGVGVKAKKVSRQRGSSVLWSRHKFDKSPTMANRSMSETQLCKSSAALESLPGNAQRGASIEPTSPKASGGAHSKNGGSAANDDHRHKPLAASSSQQDVRFDVGSSEDDTPSPSTVPKPALPQSPQLLMTRQQPQPPMDSIAEGRGSVEGSFSSQPSSRQNSESHYVPTSPLTSSSSFASSGPFRVDVKMIDFAHVTYSGFHATDELHSGPDHGYLFGLDNLVSMLNQLLIADND
jgi:hypothetical protein